MPSKRTWMKFGRGGILAAIAAVIVYAGDNMASLNLPAELTPFATVLIAFGYRWVRGAQGKEPVEGMGTVH